MLKTQDLKSVGNIQSVLTAYGIFNTQRLTLTMVHEPVDIGFWTVARRMGLEGVQ